MEVIVAFWIIAIVFAVIVLAKSICVVPQTQRGVVLTLGRYTGTRDPGLRLVIPFIQKLLPVDVRLAVMEVPDQDVISKDNVAVKVTAVVYYRVIDAMKAVLEVANYRDAVSQLAQITTRSTLGSHTLDQLLGQQEALKQSIRRVLDERTEDWGVEVQNVEIRSVDLDPNMIRAMGQEAEAERGRRARVITAQGEFEAATKLAEAAHLMEASPGAMLLRYLATLKDIAVEHNSTIIFPIPSDIMAPAAQGVNAMVNRLVADAVKPKG
jgi:regulator of protease activity HflC (stomatin/prohibitin superfamily)